MNNNVVQENSFKKKFKKKFLIVIPVCLFIVASMIYGYNYIELQKPMNNVIEEDYRNSGIEVTVRFQNYVNLNTMVYDMVKFENNSAADVLRVLLQYADKLQNKDLDYIILSSKGNKKFILQGSYFKKLGQEYSYQNPLYTTRTFTENVYNLDGTNAYDTWTGGMIGVLSKQMEDFNIFIKKWLE